MGRVWQPHRAEPDGVIINM